MSAIKREYIESKSGVRSSLSTTENRDPSVKNLRQSIDTTQLKLCSICTRLTEIRGRRAMKLELTASRVVEAEPAGAHYFLLRWSPDMILQTEVWYLCSVSSELHKLLVCKIQLHFCVMMGVVYIVLELYDLCILGCSVSMLICRNEVL